jgi:hypothetical protein
VEVKYPASTAENELQVAVTYRIWVHPEFARAGVEKGGHADSIWSCIKGLQTVEDGLKAGFRVTVQDEETAQRNDFDHRSHAIRTGAPASG